MIRRRSPAQSDSSRLRADRHYGAGSHSRAHGRLIASDRSQWVDGDVAVHVTLRCGERGRDVFGLHVGLMILPALPGLDGDEGAGCGYRLVQLELEAAAVTLRSRGQLGERSAHDFLR